MSFSSITGRGGIILYIGWLNSYVTVSETGTTVVTHAFSPYFSDSYIWIPKSTLILRKVYFIGDGTVSATNPGSANLYLKSSCGGGTITLQSTTNGVAKSTGAMMIDITSIITGDCELWIEADLAGDGTNASTAKIGGVIVVGAW